MRLGTLRWMPAALVAAGMVATSLAQDYVQVADEEKVGLDQVPAAVKAKADAAANGAKFDRAFLDKAKQYRLVGRNADGATVVVETKEDGQFVSVTTRSPVVAKNIPKGVSKALGAEQKKNPQLKGYRPVSVEQARVFTAAKGAMETLFQFTGRNADGQRVRVDITPEGQVAATKVVAVHPGGESDAKDAGKGVKLPDDVAQAIKEAVPGLTITGATLDKSGGAENYVVTGKDGAGHRVSVDATPNGTVVTVRFDLNSTEVPPDAVAMLLEKSQTEQRLEGFRPQKVQRLELRQLPGGAGLVYVFFGKNAMNAPYEVRVLGDGSDVIIQAANAKDLATDAADAPDAKVKTGKRSGKKKGQ